MTNAYDYVLTEEIGSNIQVYILFEGGSTKDHTFHICRSNHVFRSDSQVCRKRLSCLVFPESFDQGKHSLGPNQTDTVKTDRG